MFEEISCQKELNLDFLFSEYCWIIVHDHFVVLLRF